MGDSFGVSSGGTLYANGAIISGNITATTLTATSSGTIAGWKINGNTLTSGSLTLNGNNGSISSTGSGAFKINEDGVLTATGATLTTLYVDGLRAGGDLTQGGTSALAVTDTSVAISVAGTLG
jgi:hypothetical protein